MRFFVFFDVAHFLRFVPIPIPRRRSEIAVYVLLHDLSIDCPYVMVDRFFLLTYNLYVGIHPGVHLRLDTMPRIFQSRIEAAMLRYIDTLAKKEG